MFSTINFIFLSLLAFTSWAWLVYYNYIEENRTPEINFTIDMEQDLVDVLSPPHCGKMENLEFYLNFLCIFACIYALAHITHITEKYINKHVEEKYGKIDIENLKKAVGDENGQETSGDRIDTNPIKTEAVKMTEVPNFTTVTQDCPASDNENVPEIKNIRKPSKFPEIISYQEVLIAQNKELRLQIMNLKKSNAELKKTLEATPNSELQNNLECSLKHKNFAQNIFVTNSHLHLNPQVFINEGNQKLNIQQPSGKSAGLLHIWQKYMALNLKEAANAPVVISPEQLKSIQGSLIGRKCIFTCQTRGRKLYSEREREIIN